MQWSRRWKKDSQWIWVAFFHLQDRVRNTSVKFQFCYDEHTKELAPVVQVQ